MNPLSSLTYYRRHKRRAVMLTTLLALAVAGLYLLIGLFQESYITPEYKIKQYLSKFSLVQPDQAGRLDPAIVESIRAHPGVQDVLSQRNTAITVPNVGGLGFDFRLLGLQASDMDKVLSRSGVNLSDGKLPQPGTNGVALSEEIVAALGLKIGDVFDRSKDDSAFFPRYANIVSPLEVVGILSGDVRIGVMSYAYLEGHEVYRESAREGVLVIAQPDQQRAVDDFLRQTISSPNVHVHTHKLLEEEAARSQVAIYALFVPVMLLVTVGITLVIGAINRLAFMRRLSEFGTLHALGYGKGWLVRRLTLETAGLAVTGWALGILASIGGMAFLSAAVYAPNGFDFDPLQVTALPLVTPLPAAVIGFTLFTALRALDRLDAVAIVERGELSAEEPRPGRADDIGTGGQPRPLAARTFYARHKGRAATLIGAMALMIVGTALIVFIFEAVIDSGQPVLNGLRLTSRVLPKGLPLEEAEIMRIREHRAVERVIPATTLSPLALSMPLIRDDSPIETYGVTPEDMAYLVELYDLELAEGHLPRPASNEIIIPWTASKNRNLHIGDVIGDPDQPIYPDAPKLPFPLVVSGIFAQAQNPDDEVWLSLMSRQFVEHNRDLSNVPISLIIAPEAGQKAALDDWLQSEIAGEARTVVTHDQWEASLTEAMTLGLLTISLMESIVALMAALALAGLNYIFVTQRQTELGVLNALGFGRWQLVWRITRETFFVTGAAWLAGVLGCAALLAYLQHGTYAPLGLRLNFFNPTPWLYTLPVPAAVLVVSAGAAVWALSRLDPVAVIERR